MFARFILCVHPPARTTDATSYVYTHLAQPAVNHSAEAGPTSREPNDIGPVTMIEIDKVSRKIGKRIHKKTG